MWLVPLLGAACGGNDTTPSNPTTGPAESAVHRAAELKQLSTVIRVGGAPDAPDWQVTGFGSVWVSNFTLQAVQRIDPTTGRVIATVPVGPNPCNGMAIGFGRVWAPDCVTNTLYAIDPATNRVTRRVRVAAVASGGEGTIAAGEGGVWLATSSDEISRIDPRTGSVVAKIAAPRDSYGIATGFGAVWATGSEGVVSRIDPSTNAVVERIHVAPLPRFIAVGEGAVWVLSEGDGTVSRIDPASNQVRAIRTRAAGSRGYIAAGEGGVWVTVPGTLLLRIDPATNQVTARYTGPGVQRLSVGFGAVWLSNLHAGTVWRIPADGVDS
jgi:virginiamycin B lyase